MRKGHSLDSKIAFDIGWDLASYGLRPPVLPNDALLSGYEEASTRRNSKPLVHDRFTRKWLQLRINAWLRHRVVDEAVTPEYLRKLDVKTCPVLCTPLTYGTGESSDWSVDRLNNDGAYAPGNLLVMSAKANTAKGRKSFDEVVARAEASEPFLGLEIIHWTRMAALMVVPCHIDKKTIPMVPYPVYPPPEVPLSFDQTLQWIMVNQCYGGPKAVIGKMKSACATPKRRLQFHQLLQKVRRKSEKLKNWPEVWLTPTIWAAFTEFVMALDPDEVNRLQKLGTSLSRPRAPEWLKAWQLAFRGYAPGYAPMDEQTVAANLDRVVDDEAYSEITQAFDDVEWGEAPELIE